MKSFLYLSFIFLFFHLGKIHLTNQTKKKAQKSYNAKNYKNASNYIHTLLDSLKLKNNQAELNLGHCYYLLKDTTQSKKHYTNSSTTADPLLKSIAQQQLGILSYQAKDLEKALAYSKESLKINPANEQARYNYEVIKKILEKKQNDQQKNKDNNQSDKKNKNEEDKNQDSSSSKKDKKESDNSEKQKKEGEKKQDSSKDKNQTEEGKKDKQKEEKNTEEEKEASNQKKEKLRQELKKLQLSEEKANAVLEAMKNNEVQYLQQQQRKTKKNNRPNQSNW